MSDHQHHDITGALAILRDAMRALPVPPPDILTFAAEACSAAGYPPTTPELDDKLRAFGMLFGKAAPGPADLTHFLWHVLEGNIPLSVCHAALATAANPSELPDSTLGARVQAVLESMTAELGDIYGKEMVKPLARLLRAAAARGVGRTADQMQGEVAAERSERLGALKTIKALEDDLTKIARAYYGEEAPTGISADGIAEFIEGARSMNPGADLVTIRTAYAAAVGHDRDASAKAIAEYITALTSAHAKLSERGHALRMFGWDDELQPQTWAVIKLAELRKNVADMGSAADDLRRQRDEAHADVVRLREACQQYSDEAEKYKDKCETQKAYRARLEAGLRARGWNGEQPVESVTEGNTLNGVTKTQAPEMIRLAAVPAYAARWLKACKLLGWDTEADPAISADGIGKMTAFMERMQALLVKPLRDELRSRQAPNLAAFGFEKATPERIVEIAAERSQADAREIGRLRAANRDLSAKIESAPGSGLRKRLKEAERIAGNPGELERRQVELEKVNSQIREATAQRNAVLAAARKDPTGKDEVATEQQREEHRRSMSRLYNDAYKKAAEPHPHAHAHMLEHLDLLVRGKGPSAADVLHGAWAGDTIKTEDVTSDVVWDGKAWVPRSTRPAKLALYACCDGHQVKVADAGKWTRGDSTRQGGQYSNFWRTAISGRLKGGALPAFFRAGEQLSFMDTAYKVVLAGTVAHVTTYPIKEGLVEWLIEVDHDGASA